MGSAQVVEGKGGLSLGELLGALCHCPSSPEKDSPQTVKALPGLLGLTPERTDQLSGLLSCRGIVVKHHVHAGSARSTRAPRASRLPQQLWPGDSAIHL